MKEVFSEYGIPRIVMYDNGLQFASKEFQDFSEKYGFIQKTSSPRYPKSNGLVERMVQTVKQTMKKCNAVKEDPYMAMLIYRTTPLTNSIPAPAELLNGRKYRALLPSKHAMQSVRGQYIYEQMLENKATQAEYYDRSARELPPIQQSQDVYVQTNPEFNKWTRAVVTEIPKASQPRSYTVEAENVAQLQRTRCFIKPANNENIHERPRRKITKPQRLIETN